MNFDKLVNPAKQFVKDNTTTILTGAGVVGVVGTAVLTGKATIKATRIVDAAHAADEFENPGAGDLSYTNKHVVKLVWVEYLPAAGAMAATITCIVFAHKIGAKEAAAMAAAYSMSENKFKEYREKVKESFGEGKETKIRDEVAQDVVTRTHQGSTIIMTGGGEVMMLDLFSGIYFKSSVEAVKKAINEINYEILNEDSVELTQFYDKVGIPKTGFSDIVGWNAQMDQVDISIHATITDANEPCIAFGFTVEPEHNHSVKF